MNLRHHLVDVVAEFFYPRLVYCRNEYAGSLFLGEPTVFKFVQAPVGFCGGSEGEFVIFFPGVCIYLVENYIHWFIGRPYILQGLFHHLHLFFEFRV